MEGRPLDVGASCRASEGSGALLLVGGRYTVSERFNEYERSLDNLQRPVPAIPNEFADALGDTGKPVLSEVGNGGREQILAVSESAK